MKKSGISLIVLVITIIVIIIIAGGIILTLSNNGILDQSKKARFMSDFTNVQEGVTIYSLGKYNAQTSEFDLPLKGYLTEEDKTNIKTNVPTLNTKIEQLSGTLDTVNLAWISSENIGAKLSKEKQENGYIIDVDNGQIYDYNGDYFEAKRWHTLDGGVESDGTTVEEPTTEELWDGWIKLTLYYPAGSTEKKWRLGTEGELRADPMLMWQNYTGAITIPLDRVKDVWISYKIKDKVIKIPPSGTLLVDIVPDKTGTKLVESVKVTIDYDEAAEVKEYRVGNSGWIPYTGEFTVTENCIVEARAKKTESIYDADGILLMNRNIAGSDKIYIGNIGTEPILLEAPIITRLPAENENEVAKVEVTYPENAVRKVYTVNYGVVENYTDKISVERYGTYIIAYYYDAAGNRSVSQAIYINDTTKGDSPKPPVPHNPEPPQPPSGGSSVDLAAPTITKLPAQNGDEVARIQITYPSQAVDKKYEQDNGTSQVYTEEVSIKKWGTLITAYYYDEAGNKSRVSWIRVIEKTTPGGGGDGGEQPQPVDDTPAAPTININPSSGLVSEVTASVNIPAEADKTYIKIGRYGTYEEYKTPIIVRENTEVYAYYRTYEGKKSYVGYSRIKNIQRKTGGGTGNVLPYVSIDAVVYPWSSTYGQSEVNVSVIYSDADKMEYSEDGIVYKPYTESFKVTENKRIYAKGTNAYGVTETYLDITNIGTIKKPTPIQKLEVNINVNPEPSLSTDRVEKAKVTIDYDSKAAEKYYRIGSTGELQTYNGEFEVTTNCTIYAYAKGPFAAGQTSKNIDNLIDGISEPYIVSTPNNKTQASKVSISISYDKYATVKRYSIDGGSLRDYTGAFEVTKNGSVIYAYSENVKGQKSNASYKVENIVPEPPVLVLDKGNYYLLKLNYPEGSNGREYKWKEDGSWVGYKEAGILLIKPQFKDQLIQNGTLVKIEDESGNLVTFTGDYYFIDVPISQLFENLFMRWDRIPLDAPQIVITPTEPAISVTANIVYNPNLITKQYKIVNPDGSIEKDWTDYTGSITINRNNTIIYAKGMDDTEVWTSETMKKVTNIDENPPVIKLTADLDTAMQKVAVKVNVTDDVAVGKVKWAQGTQGENYFTNAGTEIANNSIVNITSNGYYTFYAEDKVGNKQVYTLNVANVDLTAPAIDIQVNPEDTVGLTANVTIDYGDSTTKQYKVGTSNATWTNYTTTFAISSYTILTNNWQNADGTVTIYAKGKDTAGNEITVQKKVVSLDLDKPKAPIINSNSGYPILTDYGVKLDAITTITYDTRTDIDNYYSVDNGTTWKTYTGQFELSTGTVIAKSVKKNTGLEVVVSKTVAMPSDAIAPAAYDGNDSSTVLGTGGRIYKMGYMIVDSTMWGNSIRVLWSTGYYNYYKSNQPAYIKFMDSSNNVISTISANARYMNNIYTIPVNTVKMQVIIDDRSAYDGYGYLAEIQLSNEPRFSVTNGYMLLTSDPTKSIRTPYQMVTVSYASTSVQRLYRIGTTGDWLNYQDQPIKLNQGQIIYVKGIDRYGAETRIISSYTSNVTDALTDNAYDLNDSTAVNGISGKYMKIDSSMLGKSIRIYSNQTSGNVGSSNGTKINGQLTINFLNDSKVSVGNYTKGSGVYDDSVAIPNNASWISVTCTNNSGSDYLNRTVIVYSYLYEIQPSNEPKFTATNGYMLLAADPTKAIKTPYQMVTISYFSTSVQKFYKIGTGEWQTYQNQPIKVNQGETIYAKGIDQYGNTTRIISSYTPYVADALTSEVCDGNDNTKVFASGQIYKTGYMNVDSSMWSKNIRVLWSTGYYSTYSANQPAYIKFIDVSNNVISTISANTRYMDSIYTVPNNTVRLQVIIDDKSAYNGFGYLAEIEPSNEPRFSTTNGYMLITANSIDAIRSPYQMVSISYFPTSAQRLYRIGTVGDWLNYYDNPIKVDQGQTIYAKGIDQYGNETRIISTLTSNVADALTANAYDLNDTTSVTGISNKYIKIDSNMWGKSIRIHSNQTSGNVGSSNGTTIYGQLTVNFLNESKVSIFSYTKNAGSYNDIVNVPTNASWITVTCTNNSGRDYLNRTVNVYSYLYEIYVNN